MVVCAGCEISQENRASIEYYEDYGIRMSYVTSTLIYNEARLFRQCAPKVVLTDDVIIPLSLYKLIDEVKDTCTLYSLEYDDERLFPVSMNECFFGVYRS